MTTTNIYVMSGKGKYYIGKSNNPKSRFNAHKRDAKKGKGNQRKNEWILDCGSKLSISTIESVNPKKWRERERYHISQYRKKYGDSAIMNSTSGGDGPMMIEEKRKGSSNIYGHILGILGIILCFTGVGAIIGIPMLIASLTCYSTKD